MAVDCGTSVRASARPQSVFQNSMLYLCSIVCRLRHKQYLVKCTKETMPATNPIEMLFVEQRSLNVNAYLMGSQCVIYLRCFNIKIAE